MITLRRASCSRRNVNEPGCRPLHRGDRSYPFVAIRECELRLEALEAAEQEAAATRAELAELRKRERDLRSAQLENGWGTMSVSAPGPQ